MLTCAFLLAILPWERSTYLMSSAASSADLPDSVIQALSSTLRTNVECLPLCFDLNETDRRQIWYMFGPNMNIITSGVDGADLRLYINLNTFSVLSIHEWWKNITRIFQYSGNEAWQAKLYSYFAYAADTKLFETNYSIRWMLMATSYVTRPSPAMVYTGHCLPRRSMSCKCSVSQQIQHTQYK